MAHHAEESMSYYETLNRWKELKEAISRLQDEERALREGLFGGTFPNPEEGTNKVELPDGRTLKGVYPINRKVVEKELPTLDLPPKAKSKLFKVKHSLVISEYRKLDEETRKKVDSVLSIKPGLPRLEVVEPKPETVEVSP